MKSCEIKITSNSVKQTQTIGEKIGRTLTPGIMLALTGDLGSGKTAFVQGLAKGLEVSEKYYITSPTYTLINEYPGRIPLFHVDLYRLAGPDDFDNIGLYDIINEKNIIAVEWADKMLDESFSDYIAIHFDIAGNDTREICLTSYGTQADNVIRKLEKHLKE